MMKVRVLVAVFFISVLSPLPALAALCFQLSPYNDVVILEVQGEPVGGFYHLVGEDVGACGENTSIPLSGTAHLRSDGKAHFGVAIHSASSGCIPFAVQGTLDPPAFNSGTGYVGNASAGSTAVTFTAVTCPTLPQ